MKHMRDLQRTTTASRGSRICQILTAFVALLFSFLFLSGVAVRGANAQEKKKAFGVVPVQLANPFFAEIERGAKEQANKLGVECVYTASKTANVRPSSLY